MKALACHDHKMEAYCAEVRKLEAKFDRLELRHIPRRDNKEADSLTKISSTRDIPLGGLLLEELMRPLACWEVETQPLHEPSVLTITKA
jgi:hypothetical protein